MRQLLVLFTLSITLSSCSYKKKLDAENIRLSPIFSSGMVLQSNSSTRIFGIADPGGTLAVRIEEYLRIVSADKQGNWEASFPAVVLNKPFSIQVEGADTLITLNNIQTGKIFVIAGDAGLHNLPLHNLNCDTKEKRADFKIRVFRPTPGVDAESDAYSSGKWYPLEEASKMLKTCKTINIIKELLGENEATIGIIDLTLPASSFINWIPEKLNAEDPHFDFQSYSNQVDSISAYIEALLNTARKGDEDGAFRIWYDDRAWSEVSLPLIVNSSTSKKKVSYLRKRIYIAPRYSNSAFTLNLGYIHGEAEIYFNQTRIKPQTDSVGYTSLTVSDTLLNEWTNQLVIRLSGYDDRVGIYPSPNGFICHNPDSTYFRDISEGWKINRTFEDDFPTFPQISRQSAIAYQTFVAAIEFLNPDGFVFYPSKQMLYAGVDEIEKLCSPDVYFSEQTPKTLVHESFNFKDTLVYGMDLNRFEGIDVLLKDSCNWEYRVIN